MKKAEEIRKIISSRVTLARQQAGLSQAQAAKILELPRPSISEIEAGRRKISAEELVAFSKIYKVDINWLSGQEADEVNVLRDKLHLAARNVATLKSEDLELVINFLTTLRPKAPHEQ